MSDTDAGEAAPSRLRKNAGFWLGLAAFAGVLVCPAPAGMPPEAKRMAAVAPNYTNHYVFLLLGGFFIALSMQRWNLHTRIALHIIRAVGASSRRLVLGFMLATGFLSMWISNSATAMMMMPIGLGLIIKIEEMHGGKPGRSAVNFGACLMLGIAYAANIGGVATLGGRRPGWKRRRPTFDTILRGKQWVVNF